MNEIKRWTIDCHSMEWMQVEDGDMVKFSDHAAEIARLRAELDNAAAAAVANMSLSCEKEREADALRVDAMRYRWLRNEAYKVHEMSPAVLLAEAAFPVDNCHTAGFVFGDELDEQVDAAMGAVA